MLGLKRTCGLMGILAGAFLATPARGDVITTLPDIRSERSDASPQSDNIGVDRAGFITLVIGRMQNMPLTECGVVIFSLSNIPAGAEIVGASLIFVATRTAPSFNVDLYGLGVRSTATVSGSDYSAPAELIQADALQKDTVYNAKYPTTLSSAALAEYINLQAASANYSGYLFFRFSADAPAADGEYYQISSGDYGTNWMALRLAINSSSQIPEPATLTLLGAGLLILNRRRQA